MNIIENNPSNITQDIETLGRIVKKRRAPKNESTDTLIKRIDQYVKQKTLTAAQLNVLSTHMDNIHSITSRTKNGFAIFVNAPQRTLKERFKAFKTTLAFSDSLPDSPNRRIGAETVSLIATIQNFTKNLKTVLFQINKQKLEDFMLQIEVLNTIPPNVQVQDWIAQEKRLLANFVDITSTPDLFRKKTFEYETKLVESLIQYKTTYQDHIDKTFFDIINEVEKTFPDQQNNPHAILAPYHTALAEINRQFITIRTKFVPLLTATTIFTPAEKDEILEKTGLADSPIASTVISLKNMHLHQALIKKCDMYWQALILLRIFEEPLPNSPSGVPSTSIREQLGVIKEGIKQLLAKSCDLEKIIEYIGEHKINSEDNRNRLLQYKESLNQLQSLEAYIPKTHSSGIDRCFHWQFIQDVKKLKFKNIDCEIVVIEELVKLARLSSVVRRPEMRQFIHEELLNPSLEVIRASPDEAEKYIQDICDKISHILDIEKDASNSILKNPTLADKVRYFIEGKANYFRRIKIGENFISFLATKTSGGLALKGLLKIDSEAGKYGLSNNDSESIVTKQNRMIRAYDYHLGECEGVKEKIRKKINALESGDPSSDFAAPTNTIAKVKKLTTELMAHPQLTHNKEKLKFISGLLGLFREAILPSTIQINKENYNGNHIFITELRDLYTENDKKPLYADEDGREHSCNEVILFIQRMILEGLLETTQDSDAYLLINHLLSNFQTYPFDNTSIQPFSPDQLKRDFEKYIISIKKVYEEMYNLKYLPKMVMPTQLAELQMRTADIMNLMDNHNPAVAKASNKDSEDYFHDNLLEQFIIDKIHYVVSHLYSPIEALKNLFIASLEKQIYGLAPTKISNLDSLNYMIQYKVMPLTDKWNDFFSDPGNKAFLSEIQSKLEFLDNKLMQKKHELLNRISQYQAPLKALCETQEKIEVIHQDEERWKTKLSTLSLGQQKNVLRKIDSMHALMKRQEDGVSEITKARQEIEALMAERQAFLHECYSQIVANM